MSHPLNDNLLVDEHLDVTVLYLARYNFLMVVMWLNFSIRLS